jgi:hypothetical protein
MQNTIEVTQNDVKIIIHKPDNNKEVRIEFYYPESDGMVDSEDFYFSISQIKELING